MRTKLFLLFMLTILTGCQYLSFAGTEHVILSKGQAGGAYKLLGGEAAYCKMVATSTSYKITASDVQLLLKDFCADTQDIGVLLERALRSVSN